MIGTCDACTLTEVCTKLAGKPVGKRALEIPRRKGQNDIKWILKKKCRLVYSVFNCFMIRTRGGLL
jgi:hypothetical protein